MLNWNAPWPVTNDHSDNSTSSTPPAGPWDLASIFEMQTRLWNQLLDMNRNFWSLYGWTPSALGLTIGNSPAETTETVIEQVADQPTTADAEAVLESQTRLWNHFLDANRSFWSTIQWPAPTEPWLAANASIVPAKTSEREAHKPARRAAAKRSKPATKAHKPAAKHRAAA